MYNKDGKVLTQDTDIVKDVFYLPIIVKDQYGEEIQDLVELNNADKIIITNTNETIVELSAVKKVKINNEDVTALQVTDVAFAGTANIVMVSTTSGKSAQTGVTVEPGVKIGSLALSAPEGLVTAAKDVYFPLTVIDSEGNEVKTNKDLNKIADPVTTTIGKIVDKNANDEAGLFVQVTHVDVADSDKTTAVVEADKALTVTVTSSLGKVATQTVIPKAEAVPTVITGISSKLPTALRAEDAEGIVITKNDLIVEDQYGQVMKSPALTFKVESDDVTAIKVDSAAAAETHTIKPVSETEKTGAKITFTIYNADEKKEAASAFTKTYSIVKDSQFDSYTVEDVPTIYAKEDDGVYKVSPAYNKAIVVKAKTASGEVVELKENTDYTIVGRLADNAEIEFAKDATTAKKTITVTINKTGEELTKELTYSNVAPKVTEVKLVTPGTANDKTVKELEELKAVSAVNYQGTEAFNLTELATVVDFVVTDSYGNIQVSTDGTNVLADGEATKTLTLSKGSEDVVFTSNGTETANVTEYKVDSTFNVVVKFAGVAGNEVKVTTSGVQVPEVVQSDENDITAFSFTEQTGEATIDAVKHIVNIEVENATDVTGLVATFTASADATVTIGGVDQVSGITANDFTSPVTYKVTAEDGTAQAWTITVTVA